MDSFTILTGIAAPLLRANIDTGTIIASRFMRSRSTDMGEKLFSDLRYKLDGSEVEDFILNKEPFRHARILLGGLNFGCGSSREAAVKALLRFGIRCVIAPSFGEIFFDNACQNGLLPVQLDEATVHALAAAVTAAPEPILTVDLVARTVTTPDGRATGFQFEDDRRAALLEGLDETSLVLRYEIGHRRFPKCRRNRPALAAPARDRSAQGARVIRRSLARLAAVAIGLFCGQAQAEEVAVAQYGTTTSAMPWAVALEKGFFKQAGLDITAIRASAGGSADIRNMIAGGLPYAESSPAAVIAAVRAGAEVKIVSENVHTNANDVWLTMPNSPVKTLNDLKGRRLAFTTPQSTSEMLDHLLVAKVGLTNADVKYIASGPFGAELTALQAGGADVASIAEPLYTLNKDKYRVLAWARDELPAFPATIGVVPASVARDRPEVIRGILLARRRAVEFMLANRRESAEIIGRVYKLDPIVVETVLGELVDHPSVGGVTYFGFGDFLPQGMDRLMDGLRLVKALEGEFDWRALVDQSFLPADLQRPLRP